MDQYKEIINGKQIKNIIYNKTTENIKFYKYLKKNLDDLEDIDFENFKLFQSVSKTLYLINISYECNSLYLISIYNLLTNEKLIQVKQKLSIRELEMIKMFHFLDKINKKDLIIAFTYSDEVKIWDFRTWKCIFDFNNILKNLINFSNFKDLSIRIYDVCPLTFDNKNYIIISFSLIFNHIEISDIYIFDFNGNKIKEIERGKFSIKSINKYYDKIFKKNYIIIDYNNNCIKSYDFKEYKLYNEYVESENYEYKIIVNLEEKITLIGFSGKENKIRIWNFHTNEILIEYSNLFESIQYNNYPFSNNIFLWNKHYLFITISIKSIRHGKGGKKQERYYKYINMINLKTEQFVENNLSKLDFDKRDSNNNYLNVIKYPKIGECILTITDDKELILWKEIK